MSHTAGELKSVIAGFMHRDPNVFVRAAFGGVTGYLTDDAGNRIQDSDGNNIVISYPATSSVDLLLNAMNNARLYAERKVDFELATAAVLVPTMTLTAGGSLDDAVLASDGTTAVRVKKIRTPFLPLGDGTYYPVDLGSKRKWDDRAKSRWEGATPLQRVDLAHITNSPFMVIQNGKTVFVAPADVTVFTSSPFTIALDVIKWLDDYVDGSETDFLLDNCFDWLMYRSIFELNFFLKEDERVQLSAAMVKDAWDSLVIWNNELMAANVDDTNLD